MASQFFINGVQVDEDSDQDWFINGVQVSESGSPPPPPDPFPLPWRDPQRYDDPSDDFSHLFQQFRIQPIPVTFVPPPTPPPLKDRQHEHRIISESEVSPEMWVHWNQPRRWPVPIQTPIEVNNRQPMVPRDPDLNVPLRAFVDVVAEIVNSMIRTGQLYKVSENTWQIARAASITAPRAPGANDDNTLGYKVGQIWVDTSLSVAYIALDVTTANAVWQIIG